MTTRRPVWAAAGLELYPSWRPGALIAHRGQSWTLGAEHTRTLAAALQHLAGDAPAPADPDAVRAAIDEQRAVLADRSAHPDTTEEARSELAWANHALDAIAAAATREDPTR